MPTLPPVLRMRLKTSEAFPICSLLSVPRAIVVKGTKINPIAKPLMMFGQTMLLIEISRSISSIVWPNIISGFAMGFIFVPLTTMALGTLSNEQMGNASDVFNLMRNTGGSVGTATLTTLLARGIQTHQAAMVSHLTPYDPAFQERVRQLGGGGSMVETQRALGGIYGILVRQATVLSYIDIFRLLAFLCLICVPATLLFARVKRKTGAVAMHT